MCLLHGVGTVATLRWLLIYLWCVPCCSENVHNDSMLKTSYKSGLLALLLLFFCSSQAYSQTRLYQYDGKLPFVQMMLSMMVAMGILDRLPTNTAYGGDYYGSTMPSYPGFSTRGSWRQPPWSSTNYSHLNSASPVWVSPSWGVLPLESYASINYPVHGIRDYSPVWSSADMDGWVNESWETSSWRAQPEQRARQINVTLQNPQKKASSKNNKARYTVPQKPCVTNYCGLKKPDLDGLWVTRNGEMLGIKHHRYLWSDSRSRYLTGQLKIQNEYLVASIDGRQQLLRFKYKLAGNRLLAIQPNGKVRTFTRMRNNRYPEQSIGPVYGPNYYSQ